MVQGAVRGAFFIGYNTTASLDPLAIWPAGSLVSTSLINVARNALESEQQVIEALQAAAGSDVVAGNDFIALPIPVGREARGVVAIEITARNRDRREAALQVVSWAASWLQMTFDHINAGPNLRLGMVIETIAEAVKHDIADSASNAVASAIGRLLDCARVSVGFIDRDDIKITAVSNTARFEQRTELVQAIKACMREAVDQDQRISFIAGEKSSQDYVVKRSAELLLNEFHTKEVHTFPFLEKGNLAGAVCIERNEASPLRDTDLSLGETIVSIVGPILTLKRNTQLPFSRRCLESFKAGLSQVKEPGHLTLKAGLGLLLVVIIGGILIKADYRIKADAALFGEIQRAVVAPFEGYVYAAPVRAGDVVKAGTALARLDSRDLELERTRLLGELAQLSKEANEALALHDRAKLAISTAKLDQAKAKLALAEEKLARTVVTAPIDGVVVSGDLSQSLGAPLERGDLLYELAPVDRYRINLTVNERDIGKVALDAPGALTLTSQPHKHYPFKVSRIVPNSTAKDGQNFFTVEAKLETTETGLRPGMVGVAKIEAGQHPLLWLAFHRIGEQIRLKLWEWFG